MRVMLVAVIVTPVAMASVMVVLIGTVTVLHTRDVHACTVQNVRVLNGTNPLWGTPPCAAVSTGTYTYSILTK